jgi:hypothetical protein
MDRWMDARMGRCSGSHKILSLTVLSKESGIHFYHDFFLLYLSGKSPTSTEPGENQPGK